MLWAYASSPWDAPSCERCCVGDSGKGDVVGERQSMSDEKALDSVVLGDLGLRPAAHREASARGSVCCSYFMHLSIFTCKIFLLMHPRNDKLCKRLVMAALWIAHMLQYIWWLNRAHGTVVNKRDIA